jgi:putative nucleotidyltransferase with HDIG domain
MDRERSHWRERLADYRESVEKRDPGRFEWVLMACLVIGLTILLCSAYVPAIHGFTENEPAPETVVAQKTVTVIDMESTERAKALAAKAVPPVYVPNPEAFPNATSGLEAFMQGVTRLREGLAGGADLADTLAELQAAASTEMSRETLEYLLTTDFESLDLLQTEALAALTRLYASPIFEDRLEGAKSILRFTVDGLVESVGASSDTADAVYEVAVGYVSANQIIDEEQTLVRQEEAMEQVAPILKPVEEGNMVVQEGEEVTAQDLLILQALGLTGTRWGWKVWLGIFFIVLLEVVVFSRLLYRFHRGTREITNNMLLALAILMLGGTAIARLLIIQPLSAYVIPVAAMGMVVSVILNARSALLLVTLASVNVGLLTDFSMRYTMAAFLVGALSLYLVSKVTKRAALFASALVSMFLSAFTIFILEIFTEASVSDALRSSLWGFGNGFLTGFLTVVLLLLLESVLNVTTPLRLLELADPAHPLLKRLLQVAPGTYNHSIMMGTLAEAAAEAIGANPNLARVGAYYHDIGKIVRPEYFVENQIYVGNPHDHLTPHLSKVAISAHVRDGERLGRVHGLPKPVVDIIKQHHGTSLLAYFYDKAKAMAKEPIPEESYRYEGEKPQSKEAAIIMLADGVEAAVRALERPTRRKIQGVIEEIIRQRTQDGQLDESALTQGDLHMIGDAFDASLVGLLWHRISYPEAASSAVSAPGRSNVRVPRRRIKPKRFPGKAG